MVAVALGPSVVGVRAARHPGTGGQPNPHWHGGPVQRRPRVYIIFWGPKWSSDASHGAMRMVVVKTIRALRGSSFQRLLTQYYDRAGHITGDVRLAGVWYDRTIPRRNLTGGNRGVHESAEAIAHAVEVNRWRNSLESQYLLLVQSPERNGYCGDDVNTSLGGDEFVFSIIPWLGPIASGCGAGNSLDEAYGSTVSHEYADLATDPLANAWAQGDPAGHNNEIADLCNGDAKVHGVWMQKIWSNRLRACAA